MASRTRTARRRAVITAIPLLLVNIVAFSGQFGYINEHVAWILPGKIVFALALETVALFLGYMAHQALMAEDSAYGLRLASYGFGAVIGAMNYSHYAGPHMRPTFEAVATGLFSLASPWLWGIYSRRQSRDALKAKGLIEPRAVKLGVLRWLLWSGRTWKVYRRAVWSGVNKPDEALSVWRVSEAAEREAATMPVSAAESESEPLGSSTASDPLQACQSKADAVRVALAELGESVTAAMVASWLSDRGWNITPKYARTAISRVKGSLWT